MSETQPICELRMKHIEEKISDLKSSVCESRDLIREVIMVSDSIEDSNKELSDAVKILKDNEMELQRTVAGLKDSADKLALLAKFAKPVLFAVLALGLSALPGGLEIIKLLAGLL